MGLLLSPDQIIQHPDFTELFNSLSRSDLPDLPAPTGEAAETWKVHKSLHGRTRTTFTRSPADPVDNEALSLVGDNAVKLFLTVLMREWDDALQPGAITSIKGALESNVAHARLAVLYDLPSRLQAYGTQASSIRASPGQQADVFEAYIGAVYESLGHEATKSWLRDLYMPSLLPATTELVRKVYNAPVAFRSSDNQIDAATEPAILIDGKPGVARLTEWAAQKSKGTLSRQLKLQFDVEQDAGSPTHKPMYTGTLAIDGKPVGRAVQGRAKKLVEHQLAHNAMQRINSIDSS